MSLVVLIALIGQGVPMSWPQMGVVAASMAIGASASLAWYSRQALKREREQNNAFRSLLADYKDLAAAMVATITSKAVADEKVGTGISDLTRINRHILVSLYYQVYMGEARVMAALQRRPVADKEVAEIGEKAKAKIDEAFRDFSV